MGDDPFVAAYLGRYPLLGRAMHAWDGTRDHSCQHPQCVPAFDEDAARGLDEWEVQRRWPRFEGMCPDCGALMIVYASAMHFAMGDW